MEKMIHGNPSGCDVQVVLQGGCIKFTNQPFKIETMDILPKNIFLVNTLKERDTKTTVEKVLALKSSDPDQFESTIGAIGDTTEEIIDCYKTQPVNYF